MAALFLTASPSGNTTQPRSLSLPRSTPISSLFVASLLRNPFPPAAAPCRSSPIPRSFLSPLTRSPSLCGSPAPRSPPPQLTFHRCSASPDAATPDPDPSLLTLLPILFPLSAVKPTPPPDQIPFSLNPFLLSLLWNSDRSPLLPPTRSELPYTHVPSLRSYPIHTPSSLLDLRPPQPPPELLFSLPPIPSPASSPS